MNSGWHGRFSAQSSTLEDNALRPEHPRIQHTTCEGCDANQDSNIANAPFGRHLRNTGRIRASRVRREGRYSTRDPYCEVLPLLGPVERIRVFDQVRWFRRRCVLALLRRMSEQRRMGKFRLPGQVPPDNLLVTQIHASVDISQVVLAFLVLVTLHLFTAAGCGVRASPGVDVGICCYFRVMYRLLQS